MEEGYLWRRASVGRRVYAAGLVGYWTGRLQGGAHYVDLSQRQKRGARRKSEDAYVHAAGLGSPTAVKRRPAVNRGSVDG